jgi:hypothetical protein
MDQLLPCLPTYPFMSSLLCRQIPPRSAVAGDNGQDNRVMGDPRFEREDEGLLGFPRLTDMPWLRKVLERLIFFRYYWCD